MKTNPNPKEETQTPPAVGSSELLN